MASRRGVQRPKVCNCRQTHFWKKIKTKIKKVKFAPLSSHTRPKIGLLDKRVPGRAPRSSEKRVFQKWAFRLDETLRKYRFAIICIVLKRNFDRKKRAKKVKSNKTYVFYCSRCKNEAKSLILLHFETRPPNRNNKQPRLGGNGFACAWWHVCPWG